MFKALSMLHLSLEVEESDAPQAGWLLASYGVFSPEHLSVRGFSAANPKGQLYVDAYYQAQGLINRLTVHYGSLPEPAAEPDEAPSLEALQHVVEWLGELEDIVKDCDARKHHFQQELARETALLKALEPFKSLHQDLGRLTAPKRFLETRLGTVPEADVGELCLRLDAAGALFEVFGIHDGLAYMMVIAPKGKIHLLQPLADAANWHDLVLPPEFHGAPQEVEDRIRNLCGQIVQRAEAAETLHRHTQENLSKALSHARRLMELAEPYARMSPEAMAGPGSRLVINGWIPSSNAARLKAVLEERLAGRYTLTTRQPHPEESDTVPSALRYPNWLGPFAELVRNYGIPCYGDLDPTLLFAVSFVVMFGMMFGDVGHGLLIVGIGFMLRGKARRFRILFFAAGAASVVFGVLYGSIFGIETLIRPLWIAPLHDPLRALTVALWWGIGFILVTLVIYIRNRLIARDWPEALFGASGIGGGLLYLGGIAGIYRLFDTGDFGYAPAIACGSGFLAVLIYNCAQQTGRWPDKVFTSLFNAGESAFAFFTNTLSFMRVAAFSINHAALALAVFTLAGQMGNTGRWITLTLGNVAILGLEGGMVAIQVLRLEYYEGFSRLFTCQGREFKPLRDNSAPGAKTN
jgi:V/A-type H+/Na+-transporting ATPase subunit I